VVKHLFVHRFDKVRMCDCDASAEGDHLRVVGVGDRGEDNPTVVGHLPDDRARDRVSHLLRLKDEGDLTNRRSEQGSSLSTVWPARVDASVASLIKGSLSGSFSASNRVLALLSIPFPEQ